LLAIPSPGIASKALAETVLSQQEEGVFLPVQNSGGIVNFLKGFLNYFLAEALVTEAKAARADEEIKTSSETATMAQRMLIFALFLFCFVLFCFVLFCFVFLFVCFLNHVGQLLGPRGATKNAETAWIRFRLWSECAARTERCAVVWIGIACLVNLRSPC